MIETIKHQIKGLVYSDLETLNKILHAEIEYRKSQERRMQILEYLQKKYKAVGIEKTVEEIESMSAVEYVDAMFEKLEINKGGKPCKK